MAHSYLRFPENFLPFDGEKVLVTYLANRKQSPLRLVGGRLYLTSHRILFSPNKAEQVLAAKEWWALGQDVIDVSVVPRRWREYLGGGGRKRMKVDLRSGASEFFVVNGPEKIVEEVQRWRSTFDSNGQE